MNRLNPSLLLLLLIFTFHSCDDSMDGFGKWPSELRLVSIDYVTSETAYLTANLETTVTDMTEMGFCWATTNPPNINDNIISFQPSRDDFHYRITDLEPGITFYIRAYYVYQGEVFYSNTKFLNTPQAVTDNDGNTYQTVVIGNQLWMAENLRVSTFRNGNDIPDGTGRGNYSGMESPTFFFHYDDNPENTPIYGKLYTWHTVTDSRGICPAGWHVPDIADWEKLARHLDSESVIYQNLSDGNVEISPIVGGMLRTEGTHEEGSGLWAAPNQGASNITRFNAVPGGYRDPSGAFDGIGHNASFWCFTQESADKGIMLYTHFFNPGLHANAFTKASGYSVRCMRMAD